MPLGKPGYDPLTDRTIARERQRVLDSRQRIRNERMARIRAIAKTDPAKAERLREELEAWEQALPAEIPLLTFTCTDCLADYRTPRKPLKNQPLRCPPCYREHVLAGKRANWHRNKHKYLAQQERAAAALGVTVHAWREKGKAAALEKVHRHAESGMRKPKTQPKTRRIPVDQLPPDQIEQLLGYQPSQSSTQPQPKPQPIHQEKKLAVHAGVSYTPKPQPSQPVVVWQPEPDLSDQ